MDWITGIQNAINYIESHLTEPISYEEVAAQSFSSSYHFQRVFSILCGFTLGEYIRSRRLTLAGMELAEGKIKVIDAALKYGYESPDSFAKAFQKFHGILPSQARSSGSSLKSFSPLVLKISLEGGNMMKYRIEDKPAITITGLSNHFRGAPSDRYHQQHDFMVDGATRFIRFALRGMSENLSLEYGVVSSIHDTGFDFTIGTQIPHFYNEHLEKTIGKDNANILSIINIPSQKYLIVETEKSALCIQNHLEVRRQAVTDWIGGSKYELTDAPEITVFRYDLANKNNSYIELWLPITQKQ